MLLFLPLVVFKRLLEMLFIMTNPHGLARSHQNTKDKYMQGKQSSCKCSFSK